jgi:two-component system, response regulator PdtaR
VRRVLVVLVDDDPVVRVLAGRVLRRAGMGCLGFASADDALPALAELRGEVSVLVTDVQMPGSMDGLGLAAHAGEAHPGLPVVVMSGSPGALERAAALAPVAATLAKPFPTAELARVVLGAARGWRPWEVP